MPDVAAWRLIANTLLLALGAAAIAVPVGTALALALTRTDLPLRRVGLFALAAMLFLPLVLQAAGWNAGFGWQGWRAAQPGALARPWLVGWSAAVVVHAAAAIPWATLFVALALRQVEPAFEEAALLDAHPWGVLTRVTLPRAAAGLLVAALWVVFTCATEIVVTDLFAVRSFAEEIYLGFALARFDNGLTWAALGEFVAPSLVFLFGLIAAGALFARRLAPAANVAWATPRRPLALGGWRWPALAAVGLTLALLLGAPLANLIHNLGLHVEQLGDRRERVWSAAKALTLLLAAPAKFQRELLATFLVAIGATAVALALATPLAWWGRRGGWGRAAVVATLAVTLATPTPLVAVALIAIFSAADLPPLNWLYDATLAAPILGGAWRAAPLALLTCWLAFRSLPPALLEQAELDGAGPWRRFFAVAWPLRWPGVALAALLSLAAAPADAACAQLLTPPGYETVVQRLFTMLHSGVDDQAASLALLTCAAYALLALGGCCCAARWAAWSETPPAVFSDRPSADTPGPNDAERR